jgi:hypothetical protein
MGTKLTCDDGHSDLTARDTYGAVSEKLKLAG